MSNLGFLFSPDLTRPSSGASYFEIDLYKSPWLGFNFSLTYWKKQQANQIRMHNSLVLVLSPLNGGALCSPQDFIYLMRIHSVWDTKSIPGKGEGLMRVRTLVWFVFPSNAEVNANLRACLCRRGESLACTCFQCTLQGCLWVLCCGFLCKTTIGK